MTTIDGEVAQPDPTTTWRCPSCTRVRVDERGQLGGLVCAGDPRTGALHRPSAMHAERTPAAVQAQRQRTRGLVQLALGVGLTSDR